MNNNNIINGTDEELRKHLENYNTGEDFQKVFDVLNDEYFKITQIIMNNNVERNKIIDKLRISQLEYKKHNNNVEINVDELEDEEETVKQPPVKRGRKKNETKIDEKTKKISDDINDDDDESINVEITKDDESQDDSDSDSDDEIENIDLGVKLKPTSTSTVSEKNSKKKPEEITVEDKPKKKPTVKKTAEVVNTKPKTTKKVNNVVENIIPETVEVAEPIEPVETAVKKKVTKKTKTNHVVETPPFTEPEPVVNVDEKVKKVKKDTKKK